MSSDPFLSDDLKGIDLADKKAALMETPVLHSLEPGYLRKHLPKSAPESGEAVQAVIRDVQKYILPGSGHWDGPSFFAQYPTSEHYASILSDMISSSIGSVGSSWVCRPEAIQLEEVILDWLGKMLGLPEEFLFYDSKGVVTGGGGTIETMADSSTYYTILAAKHHALERLVAQFPALDKRKCATKMVVYYSDQLANMDMPAVRQHAVESDRAGRMRGSALARAIRKDRRIGRIPIYVVVALGAAPSYSFDCLDEVAEVAKKENMWLHVYSDHAATCFVCHDFRHFMKGIEHADSFEFSPKGILLRTRDCTCLWFKSQERFSAPFSGPAPFVPSSKLRPNADYRHFQLAQSRRFCSLVLWFVLRNYGVRGIQSLVRLRYERARRFASFVKADDRFDMPTTATIALGLVLFFVKGSNRRTENLLEQIAARHRYSLASLEINTQEMILVDASEVSSDFAIDSLWGAVASFANGLERRR